MPLEKVLIIDEDKNTCTVLRSALEKENCNVILSNDPNAILELELLY